MRKLTALFELCKLRVVALMLLTTLVGMLLSVPEIPSFVRIIWGLLGIGLMSCAGAAMNHVIDEKLDAKMKRTETRPLPQGVIGRNTAAGFSILLMLLGLWVLIQQVNMITAVLAFLAMFGYAVVYTVLLKHITPQNIVIGGLAGAFPPVLGTSAIVGHPTTFSWLMALVIFVWTPPHFWALSIYRYDDYKKSQIPMLPVTHGIPFTKLQILLYSCFLAIVSMLPFFCAMTSGYYLSACVFLNLVFLYKSIVLWYGRESILAWRLFKYSITYLMLLFVALLLDHYFGT